MCGRLSKPKQIQASPNAQSASKKLGFQEKPQRLSEQFLKKAQNVQIQFYVQKQYVFKGFELI